MRRPLPLLVAAALAAAGVAWLPPAVAAPAPAASGTAADAVEGELLVSYVAGATAHDRERARARAGATRHERVVAASGDRTEVELVRLPQGKTREQAEAELESDPAVAFAEPNFLYTTGATSNDQYYTDGSLWGMYGDATSPANQYGSQAGEAWAAGHTGSETVYVGVTDEGIQFDHPDLVGNVGPNPGDSTFDGLDNDNNGFVDDVYGWDFVSNDNTVYDGGKRGNLDKHGTHVAGTIGAVGGNGKGVAGVSWSVRMLSGKFLGRNGGTTANAIKAVDYFTGLKAKNVNIVATNNSWGGGGFSQALLNAINRGGDADILFIAAAGNGGGDGVGDNNDTTVTFPSNYECTNAGARSWDCVIAVASITSSGAKSGFSNYGAGTVDLGAPGSGIYSTLPPKTYGSYSGTSMATPHVTGGAALYASTHPGAPAAEVKNALLAATTPTTSLAGRTVTGGRLNVSGF